MEKTIKVTELREISNRIFNHIVNVLHVDEVQLEKDMYWDIDDSALYNVIEDVTEKKIGIGQLYDDIDFLQSILKDEENANPLSLMHLAPLLRYLATQVPWYEQDET